MSLWSKIKHSLGSRGATPGPVVQVCHPNWLGVRSSTYAFGDPVVEAADLNELLPLVDVWKRSGVEQVIIQGWPPSAVPFAHACAEAGLIVRTVSHANIIQHGTTPGEAMAIDEAITLSGDGVIASVGTVKRGLAESLAPLGIPMTWVPNRVPELGDIEPIGVPDGVNAGVLFHNVWLKNISTQVVAGLANGWNVHVLDKPALPYIDGAPIFEHEVLDRPEFLRLMASLDIMLHATFGECHPMMPMESYRLGVPCLTTRTSNLFEDDPDLWELTTIDRMDDADAIATKAAALLAERDAAISGANASLDRLDADAATRWLAFTERTS
jgi:hypothetical protein